MKNSVRGTISILIVTTLYGFLGVLSRLIGFDLPIFFQQVIRHLLALIILLPVIWRVNLWRRVEREDWKWFLIRGASGLASFLGIYIAFLYTDFSTVYFVSYASATIGGYLLGKFLFKEKLTLIRIFSLVIASFGLYLAYPLHFNKSENLLIIILLIAGFATSAWIIISRKITEKYSTIQTVILDYAIGLIVLIGLSLGTKEKWTGPSSITTWHYLGLLLIIQLVAQFLIVYGFQRVQAHIGSLILLFEIIIGIVLGAVIFHEYPSMTAVIGGGLIITAIAIPHVIELRK